jgi:asparagine synthase (glutamine-hydrolysing)
LDCDDLVIFTSPGTPSVRMLGDHGLIVGRLFANHVSCAPLPALDLESSIDAASSGGKSLLERHWGAYVAFIRDGGRIAVLRDPSAAVPAYHASIDGITVYFSDLAICSDLRLADRDIDEEFLRQWLTFPGLRTQRTGLSGIFELLPGSVHWLIGGETRIEAAWTPWSITRRRTFPSFEAAAKEVRSTAARTVAAQLRGCGPMVLCLAGGFDSAVVAAALANGGIFLPSLHVHMPSADPDAAAYARAVARCLGVKMTETVLNDEVLDLRPEAGPALRPMPDLIMEPLVRVLCAYAVENGAHGFVTGGSGTSLFCGLTAAATITDAWRTSGPWQALIAARDAARREGCSLSASILSMLRQRRFCERPPLWSGDQRFLAPAGIAAKIDSHPWLPSPRRSLPGKIEQVEALVRAQHDFEPAPRAGRAIVRPLMNQPMLELFLSIPTWMWTGGGRDRAVARNAFEDRLPALTKPPSAAGRRAGRATRALEHNRTALTQLLLGGELGRRRLIRTDQVERCLRDPDPREEDSARILHLASLELWLRSRVP